jgi:hypothetical protein
MAGSPTERPEYRAARDLYLEQGDVQVGGTHIAVCLLALAGPWVNWHTVEDHC